MTTVKAQCAEFLATDPVEKLLNTDNRGEKKYNFGKKYKLFFYCKHDMINADSEGIIIQTVDCMQKRRE